jgi:hypothetical protein
MTASLSIYPFYFHILVIVINDAMIIREQIPLQDGNFISIVYTYTQLRDCWLYSISIFRNFHIVFHNATPIYIPSILYKGSLFSIPMPTPVIHYFLVITILNSRKEMVFHSGFALYFPDD